MVSSDTAGNADVYGQYEARLSVFLKQMGLSIDAARQQGEAAMMSQEPRSADDLALLCAQCQGAYLGDRCAGYYWDGTASGKCAARRAADMQLALDSSLGFLPPKHRSASVDGYRPETPSQERALAAVREWIAGLDNRRCGVGLYLYGSLGVGKTFLLAAALRAASIAGYTVSYQEIKSLLRDAIARQARSWDGGENAREQMDSLSRVQVLGIDDLQAMAHSPATMEATKGLLDQALNQCQRLVITCQSSLSAVSQLESWGILQPTATTAMLAAQIADRIRELVGPNEIMIAGKSFRGR